ncbi:splicing regulatory glutamine/lysine-rich protein 1-like [Penaeus japonicus]|uniref:splicing regulatory glutamine/lysine-rich protein 1-like n=1 Tax=Penaeus japonicus TaxID=27405 RepID=UPI001C70E5E7|nr:splicing regulatory glutamine/lysine-rich protein 1-like [Penaeus japonicus]
MKSQATKRPILMRTKSQVTKGPRRRTRSQVTKRPILMKMSSQVTKGPIRRKSSQATKGPILMRRKNSRNDQGTEILTSVTSNRKKQDQSRSRKHHIRKQVSSSLEKIKGGVSDAQHRSLLDVKVSKKNKVTKRKDISREERTPPTSTRTAKKSTPKSTTKGRNKDNTEQAGKGDHRSERNARPSKIPKEKMRRVVADDHDEKYFPSVSE